MKRFDTFGAYMFDLLFAPLKRGKRAANQFFIFFKVIGRIFDGMKKDAFRLRDELNVATASPVMLPVHGQDRDMPRLEGESIENYRARLSMKGIISEWGGTKSGILYALTSLGYEQSTIEPFSYQDPERWAEFIVFLKDSKQSGVNNLAVIDAEVRKVKEGSSRPEYGIEERTIVEIREWSRVGLYSFPICGRLRCGQHPGKNNNVGYLLRSNAGLSNGYHEGRFGYVLSGTMRAQQPPYNKERVVIGQLQDTDSKLLTAYQEGQFNYVLSGTTRLSQGEDNGRPGASDVATAQEFTVGLVGYPRTPSTTAQRRLLWNTRGTT